MSPSPKAKVLFILKQRHGYHGYGHHQHHGKPAFSSGLYNSALFAKEMLERHGYVTKIVEVVDANDIDREVFQFKPDTVIIEALWCPPYKFDELTRLHKKVRWIVRLHSEMPFLAIEGIAVQWVKAYIAFKNVFVAGNTSQASADLASVVKTAGLPSVKILLLPTYYPIEKRSQHVSKPSKTLKVVCPGAIRPFKNQFVQAIAAMQYAEQKGKRLAFYVNTTRSENGGDALYKNIVNLFRGTPHELHGIDWLAHDDFIKFVSDMDLGLQCSFTETMNICAADIVSVGVPLVASPQIDWTTFLCQAEPTDTADIAKKMGRVTRFAPFINDFNMEGLEKHSSFAEDTWLKTV